MQRRQFIATTLVAGGMLAIPGCAGFDGSANNRVNMALIGCGRISRSHIRNFLAVAAEFNAQFSAVCDLDGHRAEDTAAHLEELYAQDGYKVSIKVYHDYRKLLRSRSIDLVVIGVPDHWHARIAIDAAEAGKDLYLEKPITFTISEGSELVRAVRENRVVFQAGTQQRSSIYFRRVCELARNGLLGDLRQIQVFLPQDSGYGNPEPMPVPKYFDFQTWLGDAPLHPYTIDRCHPPDSYGRPGWMQVEDTCLGMITNWGSHMLDIAQWGRGDELGGPVWVKAESQYEDRGLWNVHTWIIAECGYADGVNLLIRSIPPDSVENPRVLFMGSREWAVCQRGSFEASDRDLLRWEPGPGDIHLYPSSNHQRDFLEAVRSRKDTGIPVEVAHRSNSLCLLNAISAKLKRRLSWDPDSQRFLDDAQANRMLFDMRLV